MLNDMGMILVAVISIYSFSIFALGVVIGEWKERKKQKKKLEALNK